MHHFGRSSSGRTNYTYCRSIASQPQYCSMRKTPFSILMLANNTGKEWIEQQQQPRRAVQNTPEGATQSKQRSASFLGTGKNPVCWMVLAKK